LDQFCNLIICSYVLFLHFSIRALLEMDESLVEAWHQLQVINDSLSAKVGMLEDAVGEAMSKENEFDTVDNGCVTLVDNKIVKRITVDHLSLSDIFWIDPLVL